MEGALKLKVISHIQAKAYADSWLKNGPLSLIFLYYLLKPQLVFDRITGRHDAFGLLRRDPHQQKANCTTALKPLPDTWAAPGIVDQAGMPRSFSAS
jgi:hypothetical protein